MTNYYTTFISKAELAHLRKSHAALRGWCGWYRREIGGHKKMIARQKELIATLDGLIGNEQTIVGKLQRALMDSIIALDDWLNTHAKLCDERRVKAAHRRINQYGTILYIARVQERNRKALDLGNGQ